MDYTSPWALRARRLGTKLGILRPLLRAWQSLLRIDYEEAFDRATQARIRPGDCVWDVGANEGLYTRRFAGLVDGEGQVVAFEPAPATFDRLVTNTADLPTIVNLQLALSTESGEASFFYSETSDVESGLSRASGGEDAQEMKVRVERGDVVAADYPPNMIKIDVEGFELQVLEGLAQTLASAMLHTVAVEVHFQTMAKRGLSDGPERLTRLLRGNGFALDWTDPSHLIARRVT